MKTIVGSHFSFVTSHSPNKICINRIPNLHIFNCNLICISIDSSATSGSHTTTVHPDLCDQNKVAFHVHVYSFQIIPPI